MSAPALRGYAIPILAGLLVVAAGLVPWTQMAHLNLRVRPDLPWAALLTVAYLALLIAWLHGLGPPRHSAPQRRERLRLWPPRAPDAEAMPVAAILLLLALLYLAWTVMSRASALPDLSEYPTTAYRWSLFLMGGITAGVVEEVAFRGVMQGGLERHDRDNALWITSAVFVVSHITQGVEAMLLMAPGLFVTSMLFGVLARRTGTILPGTLLHVSGDLARVYFGVLHGDGSALFVT